jgi:hypothetical protein
MHFFCTGVFESACRITSSTISRPWPNGIHRKSKSGLIDMNMKLEVLVLSVSDVNRAKRFYEKLGFRLDIDHAANEDYRAIQFKPPGSEASIISAGGHLRPAGLD